MSAKKFPDTFERPLSESNSTTGEPSPSLFSGLGEIRRRVVKACQRCRLKKCKCDGMTPCTRCKADDEICHYGKQRKSDRRNYEPGFVQGLEQRNTQLRHGIVEIYRLMQTGRQMEPPVETNEAGQPLIHRLLERLGVLDPDDASDGMAFDAPWSDSCQPAINGSFRPLPQSPPATPSFQSTSFAGRNHFPNVGYRTEEPLPVSQVTITPPLVGDINSLGQTASTISGLMLSMPSPSTPLTALVGQDNTTLFNPYGAIQWPGFTPQEELYEFP